MKPGIVLAAMHGNLPALEVMVELGADLEVAASNVSVYCNSLSCGLCAHNWYHPCRWKTRH